METTRFSYVYVCSIFSSVLPLEPGSSQMIGSDVAVAYIYGHNGYVDDYNITAKSPCTGLGVRKGVCRDDQVGGNNNLQPQNHAR